MTEIDVKEIDVEVVNKIGVSSTGSVTASTEDSKDLDITVSKKEFVITGDDVYIGTIHEDTPEWLNNLVSSAVDLKVGQSSDQLLAQVGSNLSAFATEYVKLNAYNDEIAVISNGLSNTTVHVNSLDATYTTEMTKAKADIVNLDEVKVDATRATSISAGVIQSQLNTPTSALGATVSRLDVAIAEERAVRASEVDAVEVRLHDAELGISGHSSAISTLDSRVTVVDGKATANASAVTQLHTDLQSGSGTWVTGDMQVTNNLTAVIEGTKATIESHWKYDSNLKLDGITYSTGFGLATSLTNGSGLPVGQSEFWIKADKFKLMSADGSRKSSYSPFTVNITDGGITFNGRVSFNNLTNKPNLITDSNEVVIDINNGLTTTIDGGMITTGTIYTDRLMSYSTNTGISTFLNDEFGYNTGLLLYKSPDVRIAAIGEIIIMDSNPADASSGTSALRLIGYGSTIVSNGTHCVQSIYNYKFRDTGTVAQLWGAFGAYTYNFNQTMAYDSVVAAVRGEVNSAKVFQVLGESRDTNDSFQYLFSVFDRLVWITVAAAIEGSLHVKGNFRCQGNSYIVGTHYPFTAGHHSKYTENEIAGVEEGDLLSDIEFTSKIASVSNATTKVKICNKEKDKHVIGVFTGFSRLEDTTLSEGVKSCTLDNKVEVPDCVVDKNEGIESSSIEEVVLYNSIGEGAINVCSKNGNIELGDYLCSSGIPGKAMKQDDDIYHNYTAAKARDSIIWENEVVGKTCKEINGYKYKQLACIYLCG